MKKVRYPKHVNAALSEIQFEKMNKCCNDRNETSGEFVRFLLNEYFKNIEFFEENK